MLDEILRFAFLAVVESTFFRVGCWVIRVLSAGNVTVTSRRPIVIFVVSLLGLATALVMAATFVTVAHWL